MSELLEGYEFYRSVQGKKYDKSNIEIKNKLQEFRENLGKFTDNIFRDFFPLEKGKWQNSGNFSKYMWNRYKPQKDNSQLVIYFNASTGIEGLFVSIGLIDDKISDFEEENQQKIYEFLEEGCKKITSQGFIRKNTGWGERVFSIQDVENFEKLDYSDLISKLKNLYDKTYNQFYSKNSNEKDKDKKMPNDTKQTKPLNQILYGPPGTGKTYNTINKAIEIIENRNVTDDENRDKLKEQFEAYKKEGQIEFVTFHQSYGYEEFVEGIKADLKSEEVKYKLERGIFQKIAKKAKENYENTQKSSELLEEEERLFEKMEQFLQNSRDEGVAFKKTQKSKTFTLKDFDEDDIIVYTEESNFSGKTLILQKKEFYKIIQTQEEFKTSRQLAKDVFGIDNQRQKDTYYLSMYREFQNIKDSLSTDLEVKQEPLKNYIIIIDEINRGNISKIFGELIMLIEESKRLGESEHVEITLPYSGEKFSVPRNLYIIGTMNTADRSIALMDTALRRRFEFTEMMPNLEVLNDIDIEGIKIKSLLETINQRIEYLYDRDHTIGHAYFMDIKSKDGLDSVMRNKVIPLLQEYFYDDWEKILMVLGEGFIDKKVLSYDIFSYKQEDYLEELKISYSIKHEFDYAKMTIPSTGE